MFAFIDSGRSTRAFLPVVVQVGYQRTPNDRVAESEVPPDVHGVERHHGGYIGRFIPDKHPDTGLRILATPEGRPELDVAAEVLRWFIEESGGESILKQLPCLKSGRGGLAETYVPETALRHSHVRLELVLLRREELEGVQLSRGHLEDQRVHVRRRRGLHELAQDLSGQ